MNRILLVEDEKAIASMTKMCLTKNGYICDWAMDGQTATGMMEEKHYDLMLLDVMLPDMEGYELLANSKQLPIPVIFVTAKTSVPDKVKGLRMGAEDYMAKPFDLQELLARVETVLRRFHKVETRLEVGNIEVDTAARLVRLHGKEVALTAREYDLLLYLIRNQGIALYRDMIYEQVWQEPYYGNTRTIDLHIQRLKKKLQLENAIETIYKVGYKFSPEKLL